MDVTQGHARTYFLLDPSFFSVSMYKWVRRRRMLALINTVQYCEKSPEPPSFLDLLLEKKHFFCPPLVQFPKGQTAEHAEIQRGK